MKTYLLTIILFALQLSVNAQQSAESLTIHDTRDINNRPNFLNNSIRADFKRMSVLGFTNTAYKDYSTNITIAPWSDNSGGLNHQINFNNKGIFYRNGDYNYSYWNQWNKLITSDLNGNVEGYFGVISTPSSQNNQSQTSFAMINRGIRGGNHTWKIFTASYAGAWGVKSNGYEIWEYPELSSSSVGDSLKLNRRRLAIQTNRGLNDCSPLIIGPRGGLSIGYPSYYTASDINDLSVNGNVGIGTANTNGFKLAVNGTIKAKEIIIELTGWADFVFDENYNLPSLKEVSSHIKEKGHLPNIPSAAEVAENGINVGEINARLLQKIEELTLYTIQQQKLIESMQNEIEELKSSIKR